VLRSQCVCGKRILTEAVFCTGVKRKKTDDAPSFKIGNLNSGLTEETKKQTIQALMQKFKQRAATSEGQTAQEVPNPLSGKTQSLKQGLKPGSNDVTTNARHSKSTKTEAKSSSAKHSSKGHAAHCKPSMSLDKVPASKSSIPDGFTSKHKHSHSKAPGDKHSRAGGQGPLSKTKTAKKPAAPVDKTPKPVRNAPPPSNGNLLKKIKMNPYLEAMIKSKLASQGRADSFQKLLDEAGR